ncbi:HIV Tat-specific factor 1 [Allomyces javanicus]|nr:HIV Tat-specific factor 1 [Allomyces javanicus]
MKLMDESRLRADDPNSVVRVSKAQFREKTEEELAAARAKKLALDKKTKVRKMAKIDRKLDWNDDAPNEKKLARLAKVVVLKHMFTLDELAKDPALLLDIKEDIREECERVGEVTSIILYDDAGFIDNS